MPKLVAKLAPQRRLTLAALVSTMYFTSCGGAFRLVAVIYMAMLANWGASNKSARVTPRVAIEPRSI